MPRRLRPDDDIYRFAAVWLGPPGARLPWKARYLAYVVGLIIFMLVVLIEAITPLHVHMPPVIELAITWPLTTLVMKGVDHDKPLASLFQNIWNVARAPRPESDEITTVRPALRRNIKITRKPL